MDEPEFMNIFGKVAEGVTNDMKFIVGESYQVSVNLDSF